MIKAYCDEIGFTFEKDLSKENILFFENYVCISNFKEIHVENLKKENLATKTSLEGLSLSDLKIENCILIPRNNLSCIRLNLKEISNIFENEINAINFKSLSLKTKIIVYLFSMDDLAELNELNDYFPEHSELAIYLSNSDTDDTNFAETLLLAILAKFKLTSLEDRDKVIDEDILIKLLQMPSIQETLEKFRIDNLDIFNCTSVFELLVEFKRIKYIEITCVHSLYDDELEEWKLRIEQFEDKLREKHSDIDIDIYYYKMNYGKMDYGEIDY